MGAGPRWLFWSAQDLIEIEVHGSTSPTEWGKEESEGELGVPTVSSLATAVEFGIKLIDEEM